MQMRTKFPLMSVGVSVDFRLELIQASIRVIGCLFCVCFHILDISVL